MPFTTSHPVLVLPVKHLWPKWFSLSGLMAGAMSPDLLYFLMMDTTHRGVTHSWSGLAICVPLGVIFTVVFHLLFKQHFILNLPGPFDRWFSGLAMQGFSVRSVRGWMILVYSVLIGALSHFFFDSFTHASGAMVQVFPILAEKTSVFGMGIDNTRFLQHFGTLVGAIVTPIYVIKYKLIPSPAITAPVRSSVEKLKFWAGGAIVSALFVCLAVWLYGNWNGYGVSVFGDLHIAPRIVGLASWAGYFYFICGYTAIRVFLEKAVVQARSPEL